MALAIREWIRSHVRRAGARTVGALDSLIERTFWLAAHRLPFSPATSSQLVSIGRRVSSAVSRAGSALVNQLLDPLVHVIGLAIISPMRPLASSRAWSS